MNLPAVSTRAPPAAPDPLDQIADFLSRVNQSDDLDERIELVGAAGLAGPAQRAAEALNAFLDKLWLKGFQLSARHEMLEKIVEIRTNEVHEILDNVSTGFMLAIFDETVLDNFSRSCVDIFGESDLKGRRVSDLLGFDERRKTHFSLAYQQVFDGFLPPEVTLGQLPTRFELRGREFSIQGAPIFSAEGQISKVFFTINDTTEIRKLEAENALRQALIEIVRQRDAFRAFLHETSRAFQFARESPSQGRLRNLLHTLKGNLGCYGLHDLAALVHSIEDAPEITLKHLQHVEETLKSFLIAHRAVIGLDYPMPANSPRSTALEGLRPLLDTIVAEDSAPARRAAVDEFLRKGMWLPAGSLLAPLGGIVERVCERLEKQASFELIGRDVLVDPLRVGAVFSNLGHLVRNSLDHGIERPDDRGDKPPDARITVACREERGAWVVEVSDDGRGIDVEALGRKAVAKGAITEDALRAMSPQARLRMVFLDGVSTKDAATMESGRGVGASALLESVEAQGGTVEIETVRGEGTRFIVRIPMP